MSVSLVKVPAIAAAPAVLSLSDPERFAAGYAALKAEQIEAARCDLFATRYANLKAWQISEQVIAAAYAAA